MVPSPFIQPAQIFIPQQATYIQNTHRMHNPNQQPQQYIQQQVQYPQNYVSSNSQPQQLPYMNQPYQSNSYTQPNQQHQSVVSHVTSTQPQNNPYQQPAQHQMLVQNPPQQPQQREKKIIRIIDPSTGKTLNDEIRTNRMSSLSVTSTNQVEEVKDQTTEVADDTKSKVCQEFAALVAARCKTDQPQTSQTEDSKSEELAKNEEEAEEEVIVVEKPEEPKVEEKLEETKEAVTVEPEEKPDEEVKPEEQETIVEEKPEKTIEEKSSETEDKDSSKGKKARKNKEQNSPTTNTTGAIAVDIEIKREERPSLSPPTSEIPEEIKASSLVESSPEINDTIKKIEDEVSEENGVTPLSESPQVVTEDDSESQEKPVDDETEDTDLQRSDSEEQSTDPPSLKYDYKENQWSPLNTEGKKQYDREFLMRLQYDDLSKKKPDDLPKLDIILTQPICNDQSNTSTGMERQDFLPYFQQQTLTSGRMSGSMHRQKSRDFNKNRVESRKVIQISREKEVQFVRTANAYRPHYLGDGSDEDRHDERLFRNVRSMLNKLTPQNFNSLINKFKELEINSESRMVGVIKLIFQKAIDEPAFSVAYANLCKSLSNILTNTKMQSKEGKEFTFRSGLLNRCQEQFEKNRNDDEILEKKRGELELAESPEKRKELLMALEEHETVSKRKYLGNIRFIGELFKLKMLTENIMHGCLFELLKSHDEEKLECLCKLMKTIGKECDHKQAKPRMDQYFTQMQKIVEQKKTCSRVRFMLQDVIELRKNMWVPRRDENAPKTIAQVREEMEREAQEKAVHLNAAANNASKRRSIPNIVSGMNNRHSASGPNVGDDSGWHNVQHRYNSQRANEMDRSRMMNIASQHSNKMTDGNIQLGPSKAGWGRGASGGRSHNSSQDDTSTTSGANKFSVLQQHDELRPAAHIKGASRSAQLPPRHQSKFSGQSRGLNSRPSAEQERGKREALEMARTVATPPRGNSRESSRSRSGQRAPIDKATSAVSVEVPEMSDDELERRIKTLVDEYIQVHDLSDTKEYVKEMLRANVKSDSIVNKILLSVLERSTEARRTIGDMLNTLMKDTECIVNAQCFTAALESILEFAEDMEIDVPKIWGYIAELISPTVAYKAVQLTNIFEACLPMRNQNSSKTGELFAALLHQCASMIGPSEVYNMWQKSDLKWEDIVQNVDTFINDNQLEFTITGGRSRNSSEMRPVKELSNGIRGIFRLSKAEEMFAWIEVCTDFHIHNKFLGQCDDSSI
ncbi:DgyrCDS4553 [Dimorphilus gyrociliatus]|uniref:DgyrCDS4553 n=1 Tax=Dimorphilus gyrociliatus TaxID=2664684 RepID=A0A7I8VIS3_9ANNE|nr:DgyrCDS4553 [Dimorphilus gyrociliatus]